MKSETKDTLKQKMEGMDPLTGGFVFGKEEAWDKLQTRLDKKPAKRIALVYPLAAAVVLLAIMIPVLWPHSSTFVAHREIAAPKTNNNVAQQPAPQINQPLVNNEQPAATKYQPAKNTVQKTTTALPVSLRSEIEQPQIAVVDPVAPQVVVVKTLKKKMKVVQVNELDDADDNSIAAVHNAEATQVALGKMKVVCAGNMPDDEKTIPEIKRIERPHSGALPFIKAPYSSGDAIGQNDRTLTDNPLRIKIY